MWTLHLQDCTMHCKYYLVILTTNCSLHASNVNYSLYIVGMLYNKLYTK